MSIGWCIPLVLLALCVQKSVSTCSAYARGVSAEDARAIVQLHNQARFLVASGQEGRGNPGPQPSASNMEKMEWDDYLAGQAQLIANRCEGLKHIIPHDARFRVGQNLYISYQTNFEKSTAWSRALASWNNEVDNYSRNNVGAFNFFRDHAAGHYTQMVWGKTNKIGCGYTMYKGNNGWPYHKLYVCNYGPAGNVENRAVYT